MWEENDGDDAFDVFSRPLPIPSTELNVQKKSTPPAESNTKRTWKIIDDGDKPFTQPFESKKSRRIPEIIKPVLVDSFETEAQTEFSAAKIDAETGAASHDQSAVVLPHQIRHDVALPPDYDYVPISQHQPSAQPARTYPFTLDPFQKTSIASIERNESVLVSAHTSAGKTVVAEYAIALALQRNQRVIYTSPIKALSNQKFRELSQEFGDVGLMTGDVTINPSAGCLVMTTEILRSMMYRGSEVMREVAWVVFDEIHYMRDKMRGVVWEEAIILLPHKVRYVFLSATIPNAKQFAEWICKIHKQPCHVVYTNFRPVPLQHYVFAAGGDGIHLCVDEKGTFRESNFVKCLGHLSDTVNPNLKEARGRRGGNKDLKGKSDLYKIIKMIWIRNYQPVIVFSFSKRECEGNALQMSKLDFNDETEKEMISAVYKNAMASLSEEDQQLPQILHLLPLLQRGIGIHHSGLLPILKEVIEILFQEALIKVLFATETFSIGLNMPAKTVVFTDISKWDGTATRWLTSGEYIQMSGRAGRRGLDDRGIVILMIDERMEPTVAKNILKGDADALNSAFHLTYNMILNLMRVEGISPEFILERSFFQFQNIQTVPALEQLLIDKEAERDAFEVPNEVVVSEYFELRQQLEIYRKDMRDVIHHPDFCLPFMQPGRLVRIRVRSAASNSSPEAVVDYGWAAVVNHTLVKSQQKSFGKNATPTAPRHLLDILLHCKASSTGGPTTSHTRSSTLPPPCLDGEKGEMVVVAVGFDSLDGISQLRIYLPKDLRTADSRNQTLKSIQEIKKRFPCGLTLLDPIQDMSIKDQSFLDLIRKIETLEERLFKNPLSAKDQEESLRISLALYTSKRAIMDEIRLLKRQLKDATAIMQLEELKNRKRVLRRLGYTSSTDVVELKGRVACEISTGDELVLTELIFNGVFNDLKVDQIVSLMSCFVFDEKSMELDKLDASLVAPLRILHETARRIAQVSNESKLLLDEESYVSSFRPDLMNVVLAWCQGTPFTELCKLTDVFEGSIIRALRRLEELLRQMAAACKQIGNMELEARFTEGIVKIKRGIVFAPSLYL